MQVPNVGIDALQQVAGLLATILGTFLGAMATLFLQRVLPNRFKLKLRYYAGYIDKRLFNGDFTISTKLVRSYTVEEDVELYELSNELWERFRTQATGMNDHFEFTRDRGGTSYDVDVRLFHEPGSDSPEISLESHDMTDIEPDGGTERYVNSIRIEVDSRLPYSGLKNKLFRAYDLLRDVESEVPVETEGGTYSLSCETGEPPVISGMLSEMNFSNIKAFDGTLEFEYNEEEVKVRNYEEGEVDEVIETVYKMATLFG
ncbi:hypothetical protein [Halorarum salinum]|uniref:Uncharacterized protein n=1 Tax=Halorarum salinum TaxID=2743089 RepID=A0A7D5LAP0_9EURY|nr:hypothetical protein [Halobaculum salinum]QLG62213.1 hypothetical protein HUG12_10915 [Halobaculum salinum]